MDCLQVYEVGVHRYRATLTNTCNLQLISICIRKQDVIFVCVCDRKLVESDDVHGLCINASKRVRTLCYVMKVYALISNVCAMLSDNVYAV